MYLYIYIDIYKSKNHSSIKIQIAPFMYNIICHQISPESSVLIHSNVAEGADASEQNQCTVHLSPTGLATYHTFHSSFKTTGLCTIKSQHHAGPHCSVLMLKYQHVTACMAGWMNNLAKINRTKEKDCSEPHLIQFQH